MKLLETFRGLFRKRPPTAEEIAAAIEARDLDLVPDGWLVEESDSGVRVNAASSLTYPAVWRACSLLSNDVARLPLHVFERDGEGKDRASGHPAYRLLRYTPSPILNSFQFRVAVQMDALLHGNGFAAIRRNARNQPVELLPIPAPSVEVQVRQNPLDRAPRYVVRFGAGESISLQGRDVIHIRGPGDGYIGHSVIAKARNSFGIGMAASRYAAKFYENNAQPSLVLQHPGRLSKQAAENLRASWVSSHGGWRKSSMPAVTQEGIEVKQWSLSAKDAQFLESRQFELREIANWFGLPPHKLGDTTRTSFASLEQENQKYLDEALEPWLVNWELELRDKLLAPGEKLADTHLVEFNRNAVVKANLEAKWKAYEIQVRNGFQSINGVRAIENLKPVEHGDEHYRQSNTVPIDPEAAPAPSNTSTGADQPPPSPEEPATDDDSSPAEETARALLRSTLAPLLASTVRCARRYVGDQEKYGEWLASGATRSKFEKILGPVIDHLGALRGREVPAAGVLYERVAEHLVGLQWAESKLVGGFLKRIETELPDEILEDFFDA